MINNIIKILLFSLLFYFRLCPSFMVKDAIDVAFLLSKMYTQCSKLPFSGSIRYFSTFRFYETFANPILYNSLLFTMQFKIYLLSSLSKLSMNFFSNTSLCFCRIWQFKIKDLTGSQLFVVPNFYRVSSIFFFSFFFNFIILSLFQRI